MNYEHIVAAAFLSRQNRFTAHVLVGGEEVVCHVRNTGRLRELLYPGASLLLEYHPDAACRGRKTAYSLIGVYKDNAGCRGERLLINIDSQAPNLAAGEWLLSGGLSSQVTDVKREVSYGKSRFDLAFKINGRPAFMEVKGVTLETDGTAYFPDAPTERGVKHIRELVNATRDGYPAYILFVIQMKGVNAFTPNRLTHMAFAEALQSAAGAGVCVLAYDCLVTESSVTLNKPVTVIL